MHPARAARVAILDWDVHHGNGTQDAFFDDPSDLGLLATLGLVLLLFYHDWRLALICLVVVPTEVDQVRTGEAVDVAFLAQRG